MATAPFVLVDVGLEGARAEDEVALPAATAHHLRTVLRVRVGEALVVADGAGWQATATCGDGTARLAEGPRPVPDPAPHVHVWQALGKGRKHDDVVRVLTELGADAVTAVLTQRTVARPEPRRHAGLRDRWAAVARSACEQARRPRLPVIAGPADLGVLLAELRAAHEPAPRLLVADTEPDAVPLGRVALDVGPVVVAVGPEGGFTDDERMAFRAAGATSVGLGPWVLRTEHAAGAAVAVLRANAAQS